MKFGRSGGLGPLLILIATPALADPATDIVVRGEKTARSLEETTSSVAVFPDETIRRYGLQSLSDIVARTANVAPTYGASGFAIRGIANNGVTGAGEAATANVFIDGIPLAPTFLHAGPTDLWDVAQVEIWRGPQSTLRGQNALAGTVIVETKDPSLLRWDARARTYLGDDGSRAVAAATGGPLAAGELAGRVAMEFSGQDGYIRNVTRGAGEDAETRATLRAKLLWQPAAWPGFRLNLAYTHFRRRGAFYTVYARTDAPDFMKQRIATDNTPNTTGVDLDGLRGEARYDLGGAVALVSETTWSGVKEISSFDSDYGPANLAFGAQQRHYRTFSQELRLTRESGRLTGVAGLYFFDRRLRSATQSRTSVPTPIATIAGFLQSAGFNAGQAKALASTYGAALPAISVDFSGSFPTKVRTFALFADLRYRLTDRLSLLGGLRAEHFEGTDGTLQQARFAGTLPSPALFGPLAPVVTQINAAVLGMVAQANANVPGVTGKVTTLLPKAGILIDWSDTLSSAFVVQRGYRPGGVSINIARGRAVAYDPEYLWNAELSLRARLAGGRLQLGANAYYAKWRNQQVSVNFGLNSFDTNTVNAARSHIYGMEIEATYQANKAWSLFASAGHTRTRFDGFDGGQAGSVSDLPGTEFAFAPRWTMSSGTQLRLTSGIAGALSVSHSSRSFAAVGSRQSDYAVKAHSSVDARLGYEGDHWSAFVAAHNLFDETYIVYKSPGETRAILSAPRRVMVELRAEY